MKDRFSSHSTILITFFLLCANAIFAQDTLIIKGDLNYPPYEFINEHGQPDGYNVELTKALMKELGCQYEIELIDWGMATEMLKNQQADMLMGITFSEDRLSYFNFSTPHSYIRQTFAYKPNKKVKSLEGLFNKEIVIQNNTLAYDMIKDAGVTNDLVPFDDIREGLKELAGGKYDLAICEENIVKYTVKTYGLTNLSYSIITDFKPAKYCFAVNKVDAELIQRINVAFEALRESGVYDDIYYKWFGPYEETATISLLAKIIISIATILLIFAAVVIIIIRQQVKRATKQLNKINRELQLALKAGNISAWTFSLKEQKFYALYGDAFAGMEGISLKKFLSLIYKDDVKPFRDILDDLSSGSIQSAHSIVRFRSDTEDANNGYIYLESEIISVQGKDSKIRYFVGTQKDITKEYLYQKNLEESKKKTDLAVRTANMIIWEYDVKSESFTTINDPINGYNNLVPISRDEYLSVIHPDDRVLTESTFKRMSDSKDGDFQMEIRIHYPDNEPDNYNYTVVNGSPLEVDKDGVIIKYIGFRRDLTEWKNMMNELILLKDKAERSDMLKSAFLANMSHEIRTPLNSIVGFSQLLMDCDDRELSKQYKSIIDKNNELLIDLIEGILDLSKIESHMLELAPSEFDFAVHFTELSMGYQLKIDNPDVKLICDNPLESCIVRLDYVRLTQVINNLVSNAIKFTYEGEIKMSYLYDGNGLKILVSDTGIGIEQCNLDKVFVRFAKLNDFAAGTGLGLAISKAIVEQMNGQIGVVSEVGKGSTFWVYIPCKATIKA